MDRDAIVLVIASSICYQKAMAPAMFHAITGGAWQTWGKYKKATDVFIYAGLNKTSIDDWAVCDVSLPSSYWQNYARFQLFSKLNRYIENIPFQNALVQHVLRACKQSFVGCRCLKKYDYLIFQYLGSFNLMRLSHRDLQRYLRFQRYHKAQERI